jgi:RimJ/RimL family protein N-acetyltransferase
MKPSTHILKSKQDIEIRVATVDDASALIEFINDVSMESDFLTFGAGEFEIKEDQEKEIIQNLLDSENQIFFVATVGKKIVAILNFSARSRPRIRHSGEFSMVVKKKYWGFGIGSLLLDTLLEWAKSNQFIKKINLRVRTDNQRAIKLYEKRGFVKEGTLRKEIFLNDKYYDLLWMGREL